ncbi:hypothetical protein [Faunimonas pinastri]|nr:hypothetical protein [Faunimonas pinastri]
MAEIMLLLIFCLLLGTAAAMQSQQKKREQAESALEAARAALSDVRSKTSSLEEANRRLREAAIQKDAELARLAALANASQLGDEASRRQFEEDWKRLVASDETVRNLKESGLDPERLISEKNDVREMMRLIDQGANVGSLEASAQKQKALQQALSTNQELANKAPNELVHLAAEGLMTQAKRAGQHDWPPIINLSEAKGYSFPSGKAGLTTQFEHKLQTSIADQVAEIVRKYDAHVVEVVGHTDEQPMGGRTSNLDSSLVKAIAGTLDIGQLNPADNAGLGMARAVSVASVLRRDPRLSGVAVLPLSGAQLIKPADVLTDGLAPGDSKERRRIEIRVRRQDGPAAVSMDEVAPTPANKGDRVRSMK